MRDRAEQVTWLGWRHGSVSLPGRLLVGVALGATPAIGPASSALAQTTAAGIVGTVRDSSGGVLPGAAVAVTNAGTNALTVVHTDERGDFVAPSLPPGTYTVRAEVNGFRPAVIKEVRLLTNRTARVEIALEVGEIRQEVEVRATAPRSTPRTPPSATSSRARPSRRCPSTAARWTG